MQLIANALLLLAASAAAATASSSNPHRDHHDRPHQLTHQHSYRHHPVRAANITMSTVSPLPVFLPPSQQPVIPISLSFIG
jgi:hypothetical protein